VIYQASGEQLFWVAEDPDYSDTYPNNQVNVDEFSGSLQQQGALPSFSAARLPQEKLWRNSTFTGKQEKAHQPRP
jgi:hypothetical protein